MTEFKNNLYKIRGVINALPVRTAEDKKGKNGGKPYEFPSVILEVKRQYKDKEYIELPEFELGYGVSLADYATGDLVEITFSLSGKKISATWHKTVAKAIYIRHADIESAGTRTVGGDTWEERRQKEKAEKDLFVPPNPYDDEDDSDLPF